MIKNTVSSTAARLAAAALCVAAAGSLSAASAVKNLTADALSQNCLEFGYGTQHGNVSVPNTIFEESTSPSGRFIGTSGIYPTYLTVHFKDGYAEGMRLVVNRLYLSIIDNQASYAGRVPRYAVLQGSNLPEVFSAGSGDPVNAADDVGWTDIATFGGESEDMAYYPNGHSYEFTGDIDNNEAYRYYRFKIIRTLGGLFPSFTQFRLYGKVVSDSPSGLSAVSTPDAESVQIKVSVESFDETNPATTGTVYLDYGMDEEFGDGSYTRIPLATNVSCPSGNWTDTVEIENLSQGSSYYGRLTVENGIGRTSVLAFNFATVRPISVSSSGSDDTGDGTDASPFRSITKALSVASGVPVVKIGAGSYSAEYGEVFPLEIPEGTILRGEGASETTIDGGNAGVCIVSNFAHGASCTISSIHFKDSGLQPAIVSDSTDISVENCSFSQTLKYSGNTETAGAILLFGAQKAVVEGCDFSLGSQSRHWVVQTTGTGGVDDVCDLTVRNCIFEDNTVVYGLVGCSVTTIRNRYTISDCTFSGNTVTSINKVGSRTNTPGGCIVMISLLVREDGKAYPYGELTVDRCRFVSNRANSVIATQFTTDSANVTIQNSLFKGNVLYNTATGYSEGVIRTYYGVPTVANCTFIGNPGHFCETSGGVFRNCIFSGEGVLVNNTTYKMNLYGAIVHGTEYGYQSQIETNPELGAVIEADPCFADEFGHLRAYSPAVDAGVGTFGLSDLAGNPRAANNTGADAARCDFGCWESQYGVETEPTFRMPSRERVTQPVGRSVSIEVSLVSGGEVTFPIEANVAYPDGSGFTGPSTLEFTSSTAELAYTTPAEIGSYDISFSAPGVVTGVLRVEVADVSVKLFGDRLKIFRSADALEIPVSMSTDGLMAPEDISVEIVSVEGEGTTTVAWSTDGEHKIAAGSHQSTGRLVFKPGTGHNRVTLRTSTSFAESGSMDFALDVVAFPEAFYVNAAEGSDATGIGTQTAQFKSITKALAYAVSGETVRIAPGMYSASATGESFPIAVGGVALVGETENAQAVTIDGGNAVDNLFRLEGNEAALSIRNATLANTSGPIAYLFDGYIALTNCPIVQTKNNNESPAIAYLFRCSKIELEDCTYETDMENLSRQSSFSIDTTDADVSSTPRTRDRWIVASRCRFSNLRFERGLVTSLRSNGSPHYVHFSDCSFERLRMYTNGSLPGSGDNVYHYGVFHLPTGTPAGHSVCGLKVERSRFVACKCSALASVSHCFAPEFSNCLFVDMTNSVAVVWGNAVGQTNADPALFRSCTFVRTTGPVAAYTDGGPGVKADIRNSIFVESEIATTGNARPVEMSDSVLFGASLGNEALVTIGDNVSEVDPRLRNVGVSGTDSHFDASFGTSSPAFDAGNDSYAAGDFDLLGNPRVAGKHVDLGAIECQGNPALILIVR